MSVLAVAPDSGASNKVSGRSLVHESAALWGKISVSRFGDFSSGPSALDGLVEDACKYAEGYALEAGFRRCASRMGVPNTRASLCERDAPSS